MAEPRRSLQVLSGTWTLVASVYVARPRSRFDASMRKARGSKLRPPSKRGQQVDDRLTASLNELEVSFGLDWPLPALPSRKSYRL